MTTNPLKVLQFDVPSNAQPQTSFQLPEITVGNPECSSTVTQSIKNYEKDSDDNISLIDHT
jgi:hypothetical protein